LQHRAGVLFSSGIKARRSGSFFWTLCLLRGSQLSVLFARVRLNHQIVSYGDNFFTLRGFSPKVEVQDNSMANLRPLPLCVLAGTLVASLASFAQQPAPQIRIAGPIDENQLVTLKGNTHPAAIAKNDRGPVSARLPMSDLVLVLSRSAEQQAAFDAYIESEYDSGSPNFHQWLTPDQIGQRFGPAQTDLDTLSSWLTGHGFQISEIGKDHMTIRFSGTAGQVENAFHTQIHNLQVNGAAHIGNMTDPQIPAALGSVVVGIKQLHDFHPHPLHKLGSKVTFNQEAGKWQRTANTQLNTSTTANAASSEAATLKPQFGINFPSTNGSFAYLEEDVSPYDFATIYNVLPLWQASTPITGSGQTIAIVGTSDINTADVATFKSTFGLPAGLTPIIKAGVNGIDPGQCTSSTNACNSGDLIENSLDVEWSGAVAPGAQVVLVTSGYNSQTYPTNDPVYESAQYILENVGVSGSPLANAHVMSVSYGLCELAEGTAGNVSYYNLWGDAAAEGVAVFVATGDSGAPSCDQGQDGYGYPYSAQYGPSVSGIASTPYNTAVGGTDFSWCKPVYNSTGSAITGCPSSSTNQGSPAYWNTSNNTTTGASAAGYVPEVPWNDTCENPILASFLDSIAPLVVQATNGASTPANPDATCNYVEKYWPSIYNTYSAMLATYVDAVGGSGGASNCVANDGNNTSSCYTAATTGAANGSIALTNDGWQKPSWQTGVQGIPTDGVRDIPDVSFFAADGALNSAYLICVSALGTCTPSTSSAQEVGGTSVSTPAMAGVMALINQKIGVAQGSPNKELYVLGSKQTYSACSAETVKNTSASCYFNDVDQGTIAMPCSLGTANAEGGVSFDSNNNPVASSIYTGLVSPDCTGLNSGDTIGTLTVPSSTTTQAYNAGVGFDLATGLGSLNVANVVNAWVSDVGTATATVKATLSASTLSANTALTVTVTVTGSNETPTGSVAVNGSGAQATGTLSGGTAAITIPANSLAVGSDTLTIIYGGDSTYASANTTATVTVSAVAPTVTVSAPSPANVANPLAVSVGVAGPLGSTTPTGTVTLSAGSYSSSAVTLSSSGTASFTIPANTLSAGNITLTANYSGSSTFTAASGSTTIVVVSTALVTPTVKVTTSPSSIDTGQAMTATITVTGTSGTPTGTVSLTSGSIAIGSGTLSGGTATINVSANTLSAGSDVLTASYGGDGTYATATGIVTVTVTQSVYALTATSPSGVSRGATATSTVSGSSSTTGYTGTVTLTSCTATNGPSNANDVPTCTVSGTITYAAGTPSGTGTATVSTTAASAELVRPNPLGKGRGWMGAGGGAVLAFLVFLGVPARRRSWRAMLGMLILMITLSGLAACGGGGGGGGSSTSNPGTTSGTYTFTVTGQGNDPAKTSETATFTLIVN
jgi:hypothetical protein